MNITFTVTFQDASDSHWLVAADVDGTIHRFVFDERVLTSEPTQEEISEILPWLLRQRIREQFAAGITDRTRLKDSVDAANPLVI